MKDLLDKLSSYNIFNYLLPGVLFAYFTTVLTNYNLIQKDIVIGVFLYYFLGLVISRIGSIIVEPVLKKIKIVRFCEYKDYIKAAKKDKLISILSEENNMYRTFISLFFSIIFIKFYNYLSVKYQFLEDLKYIFIIFGLFVLFVFSYRKQTAYISKRVKNNPTED